MNNLIVFLSLFLISLPSYAYIGSGMGGGLITAIIGFFAAILLGLWAILYYPIKRALKNRKDKNCYQMERMMNLNDSFFSAIGLCSIC